MQLGDARLGHAEHLADLAQGQVLVVVEGDHELLALGQARDRVGDAVLAARSRRRAARDRARRGSWSVSSSETWSPLESDTRPQLVERDDRRVGDLQQRVLELVHGDARARRPSPRRSARAGAGARASTLARSISRARARTERGTQSSERSSSMIAPRMRGDRVGLELDLALEVEALDRRDQADQPVGDQVGLLDVRGQPGGHAAGDVLDQRRVGDHQPLARALVAGGLVAPPQVLELDRFDVGFQRRPPPRLLGPRMAARVGRLATARTLPECRPASSRCWRGRAAPGSRAGRRRRPAGGWRRSGAARAGETPAGQRGAGAPRCAAAGARRRSTAAGRTSTGTAPRSSSPLAQRRAAALQVALERAQRGSPRARSASCRPCPRPARSRRRSRSSRRRA